MKSSTRKPGGWSALRHSLAALEKPALIALIKELHDAAAMNRDLLHARLLAGTNDDEILEKYRRRIVEQFFPTRGLIGKLKLGEARTAIREYRKATGNIAGTAELLMTYVENGTRFTHEYGDIDECFYNSIECTLVELANLLRRGGQSLYPQFAQRLTAVALMSENVGWGLYDAVADVVHSIEEACGR